MYRFSRCAALLLTGAMAFVPSLTLANEAADDRDYLPRNIIVTGEREGYVNEDGSTGTKTPTAIIDVPQLISFVTDDQLEDQSIRQLGEALRYVPGISMETGEGHRDEIFIRGQETTADFYLDGLRDDAQYYRSLYNVERVEVLKGANALIFGRGGGGGVINRVSKQARLNGFSAEFDASVDSFGAFSTGGDVNARISEPAAVRINAHYEEFDSNRDFYEGRFIGIAPTVTVELGPETRLIASYSYDDDRRLVDRGNPADNGGPLRGFQDTLFGDRNFNSTSAKVHIARTRVEHQFSEGLSANASLQYANYDKAYSNILPRGFDGTDVEFSGYRDTQQRENWIAQTNLVWEVATGAVEHTILAGFEASRQDTRNGRANAQFEDGANGFTSRFSVPLADIFTFPAISLTAPVRSRDSNLQVLSGYIQDQFAFGDHVEVIAGLRWDRFDLETTDLLDNVDGDRVDEEVSPRFGLVVKPNDKLSIYVSYAESFLPQAGDQFLMVSPTNAGFEPEKFTNYEIGLKWAPTAEVFLTAAIFQLDRTNTRASDPNNTGLTVLTGESQTEGFEFNLVGELTPQLQVNLGYTYLDGEITESSTFGAEGTRLQQLPEHQISAWTRYDFTEKFGVGLGIVYQDEQFTSFSNTVTLPDYVRFDAAAYYEANDRLSMQLNIENLFDENYFPSAHGDNNIQPGEPFSARIGIRLKI